MELSDGVENTSKLIDFLKNLIVNIEEKNITQKQIFSAAEFMMKFNFEEINGEDTSSLSKDESMKYVIAGWYIYQLLSNTNDEL